MWNRYKRMRRIRNRGGDSYHALARMDRMARVHARVLFALNSVCRFSLRKAGARTICLDPSVSIRHKLPFVARVTAVTSGFFLRGIGYP